MRVIIVGGSIAGLCAGIVLKRLGHIVSIFESSASLSRHDEGAGIVAGDELQEFIRKFDATKCPIFIPSRSREYLDRSGAQICRIERLQQTTSWDLLFCLLRANFDGMVSEYCQVPPEESLPGHARYCRGRRVTRILPIDNHKIEVEAETSTGCLEKEVADLVIGADGASSTVRSMMLPEIKREYVGYAAWRGTVPELEVSKAVATVSIEKISFFEGAGFQMIVYTIPGHNGTSTVGERLINWIWYCNYPHGSKEYLQLMTDAEGKRHQITLPVGHVNDEIWQRQKTLASVALPPQFAELVNKTRLPFVQSITDVLASQSTFYHGRVCLVGDALAGFRPHTGSSTNQAALNALKLDQLMRGFISQDRFEEDILRYAKYMQKLGVELGQMVQFGI